MRLKFSRTRKLFQFIAKGKVKKTVPAPVAVDPMPSVGRFRMRCNLCSRVFRSTGRQMRFCKSCRNENEAYRFAEWM